MKTPQGKKHPGGLVLVEVTGEDILYYDKYPKKLKTKEKDEETRWAGYDASLANRDITLLHAEVFNIYNGTYSENSIYRGNKGDYIKKGGRRYYIKDFE
jgi:hypothetical protein